MREAFRFIKDLILKNWWLKLAAILLAYALWIMVRGAEGERVFTVPLVVQIPRGMEIVNERPNSVEIAALGAPNLTGSLPNLTYTIDLQSAGEGEQTVSLTPDGVHVSPGSGLTVIRVNPARATFVLERVIAKDVPVRVPIQGSPAAGLDIYTAACRPISVHISGPRSAIIPIRGVETDPVSLAGQRQSFQTTVNLNVRNADIHTSPTAVEVDVELGPHRETRTLRIPVTVLDDAGYDVSPPSLSVSVLVPVTFKRQLAAEDFSATVSVPNSEPLSSRMAAKPAVEITKELGTGIVIKQVSPQEVTLLRRARKK
ncbi:MAG: hypothetical protein LAP85_22525 [Acidobacteriia bacterium]|nr:hypothetical protein [Terriglobia bacterium]